MKPRDRRGQKQFPFFVYGTLRPGQPNFHKWGESIRESRPATLTGGRLYDMGFYPMLIDGVEAIVHGALIKVRQSWYDQILDSLDELEGYNHQKNDEVGYRRVQREVNLEDGKTIVAWVYVGQPNLVSGKKLIEGGDWATYASAKLGNMEQWWRGISSVAGLHGVEE